MKKIIWSIVGVLAVLLLVFILLKEKSYYPDSQNWNRKQLVTDTFSNFFPINFTSGLYLLSPRETGITDSDDVVTRDSAFIEYRDGSKINIGTSENPDVFTVISGRRALYAIKKFEEAPIFKVWTEQVSPDQFSRFVSTHLNDLKLNAGEINIEEGSYNGHNYTIYLRKDLSAKYVNKHNSIGGAYISFPEKNTLVSVFLFNTRYNSDDAYMITKEELVQVIHEFIDSAK